MLLYPTDKMELIQNKVAESGLLVLDPADWWRSVEVVGLDLRDWLFHGMVLREKDFREQLKQVDWSVYHGKSVAIFCSTDAIIPTWAFMLVAQYLHGIAARVTAQQPDAWREQLVLQQLREADFSKYEAARVILKGCGDENVPVSIYVALTEALLPHVKSLMYGEPCSTVPVFKKK